MRIDLHGTIQAMPQIGRAIQPQQAKIFVYRKGNLPSAAAGMPTVAAFAAKLRKISGVIKRVAAPLLFHIRAHLLPSPAHQATRQGSRNILFLQVFYIK
jgi:hypothetical protein